MEGAGDYPFLGSPSGALLYTCLGFFAVMPYLCLCNSMTIQKKIIHGALFEKNEILVGHDALASYDASYDSSYWHHILYDAMASSDANASYDTSVLHMMQSYKAKT